MSDGEDFVQILESTVAVDAGAFLEAATTIMDGGDFLVAAIDALDTGDFIEVLDVGPKGRDGAGVLSGFGPPTADVGRIDDFYVDRTALRFYGPKTLSGWGLGVPMGSGGSGASCGYLAPVEAPDGTRTAFTTTVAYIPTTLNVYLNGQLLTAGVDYVETTPTAFSMGEPPMPGDILRAHVTLA